MDTRSGIFRHFKFDKIFTIMSFHIFKRLGVFELWARRLAWGPCRLFNQFEGRFLVALFSDYLKNS